jgi:hypothetical protein
MNFTNVFAYINLAIEVAAGVNAVMHLGITAANPLTATELESIALPIVSAVQGLVPKANIPAALVADICNGIADSVYDFYKPKA